MNIYDYKVKDQNGNEVSLSDYKGKVILVVNTATGCGFTPQYNELQELYLEKHDKGLEILDFPCNQFGGQAPGSDAEIHEFCTVGYKITFPQFSKIDVNGEGAIPLYKWLTSKTTFEGLDANHPIGKILCEMLAKDDPQYDNNSSIKWNFTKFLIDRKGEIVERFEPTASMETVKKTVEALL